MSELLECPDDNLKFKAALTVLNAANEWGRPEAPGHIAAEDRLRKEQLDATMQINGWQKQYVAQGGQPEDFYIAMATGKFDPHAEMRVKIEEMKNPDSPDSNSNQDNSEEKQ